MDASFYGAAGDSFGHVIHRLKKSLSSIRVLWIHFSEIRIFT